MDLEIWFIFVVKPKQKGELLNIYMTSVTLEKIIHILTLGRMDLKITATDYEVSHPPKIF
jgi:hypothetical protein